MKNEYKINDIIRLYKLNGRGKWTTYKSALSEDELNLLKYAASKRYAEFGNDAPRGGKMGAFIKILRTFTSAELAQMRAEEVRARDEALSKVLKSEQIDTFTTISDVGSIKIDGVSYSNFYGDGENTVDICKCDLSEFRNADMLTRRQYYNPNEPITIVKYTNPKSIEISISDVDASYGARKIDNVCGFAIWARKMKVFVC